MPPHRDARSEGRQGPSTRGPDDPVSSEVSVQA
jgi:hypothetical protein